MIEKSYREEACPKQGDARVTLMMCETAEKANGLERLDNNFIPISGSEVRLFAKVRNEVERLPFFLNYYRKFGVNRFFIIDNCSTDHTVDLLKQNSDCHIFSTSQKMVDARAGMDWIEPLLKKYGENRWCLIVDADELLVYPNSEDLPLAQFCQRLDALNVNALPCILRVSFIERGVHLLRRRHTLIEAATVSYRQIPICPVFLVGQG